MSQEQDDTGYYQVSDADTNEPSTPSGPQPSEPKQATTTEQTRDRADTVELNDENENETKTERTSSYQLESTQESHKDGQNAALLSDENPGSSQSTHSSSSSHNFSVGLNVRNQRLGRWALVYIVFCVAEFTGNSLLAHYSYPKDAYRLWTASDFFLLLASILLLIETNPSFLLKDLNTTMTNSDITKFLSIIIAVLYLLGAFLRLPALGVRNDKSCQSGKKGDYCRTTGFAQDFLATYFTVVLAIDVLYGAVSHYFPTSVKNILKEFLGEILIRMIVYCSLMLFLTLITLIVVDHNRSQTEDYIYASDYDMDYANAVEAGFFLCFFMLIAVMIIVVLNLIGQCPKVPGIKFIHLLVGFILVIAAGLVYFSFFYLYQTLLYIILLAMIVFDLQCLQ